MSDRTAFVALCQTLECCPEILGVSADELVGLAPTPPARPVTHRRLVRRLQAIDRLPRRDQQALFRTIDALLRSAAAGERWTSSTAARCRTPVASSHGEEAGSDGDVQERGGQEAGSRRGRFVERKIKGEGRRGGKSVNLQAAARPSR